MLKNYISYYKVGALLHWISFGNLVVSLIFISHLPVAEFSKWTIKEYIWLFGLSFFMTNMVLSQMDAWSRFQNFKHLKDQIIGFGFQNRLLKPLLLSRCQRDAAQIACNDLGYGDNCSKYFSSFGYKWYHIIPDFVFEYPLFFFSSYFWRTTFFTPYYKPKYNSEDLYSSDLLMNNYKYER